ncbi:MAG TPA: protein translocase subunit SecD [Fimbriimonadaceae bacterium]|nr:protein translocase subunit SecD [Fimbriimonadaceae bacterium]
MQNRSWLFLVVVLVLGGLSGWLFTAKKARYGLDVSGGIRLTYVMDYTKDQAQGQDKNRDKSQDRDTIIDILAKRGIGLGASEVNVFPKGTDQIVVELPGATNVDEAMKRMGSSARIYMYHAKNLSTSQRPNAPYIDKQSDDPNDPSVEFIKSGTGKVIKFGDPEYDKIIKGWTEILSGTDLQKADSRPAGDNNYIPTMIFSPSGAAKMSAWTTKFYNTGEKIAYVLDGRVLNVAPLAPNAHISDQAEITGSFSAAYVSQLKSLLNAGSLPVDLKPLSYETVDPTIGNQALGQIIFAGAIAFGVVAVFLIAYYAFPGIVAAIALSLYVLFTLSVLKAIDATFSLAAIAGFILSVGMAVDANILVFERFKEEMKKGRTLHSAIDLGFRRALPAIVDSNACTILTSFVLVTLGTGPVKGFATTLIIGVLVSLFTAVVVTRSLLMFFVDSGVATNPKWYAVERNWFKKLEARADTEPLQVVEKATRWFLISGATIVVFFFFIKGFKLNVEFQGGYEAVYSTTGPVESNTTYAANLEKNGLPGGNVKFASYSPEQLTLNFTQPDKIVDPEKAEKKEPDTDKIADIAKALGAPNAKPLSQTVTPNSIQVTFPLDDLGVIDKRVALTRLDSQGFGEYTWTAKSDPAFKKNLIYLTVPTNAQIAALKTAQERSDFVAQKAGLTNASDHGFTEVGPVVQKETIKNAIMAIVLSSALIIGYLSFRFGFSLGGFVPGLRFGASAILALVHDILVVIGSAAFVGAIFGWEISALFITAMLTVIGFSVHDTIVIFDRIRENLRRPEKGHDLGFVMDRSITQSFARSLNTSMTVVVTLAILIAFGTATPELKFFCVAMLVGIVSGTYSSIYNASPILYLWDKAITKKDPKKGLIGLALEEQSKARMTATQLTTAAPQVQSTQTGRSYGQVRRRASAQQKGHIEIEDEP